MDEGQPETDTPGKQPHPQRRSHPRHLSGCAGSCSLPPAQRQDHARGPAAVLPRRVRAPARARQRAQGVPPTAHLNFLWLILGALLEIAALVAYAELTRTVLSPGAPHRWRIFRINMWALAISHTLPGGTVPGTAASYRLLTESDVTGSTAAFGLATQGIGSAVVLNIIFWLALLISIPLQGYNPLYGFAAILGVLLLAIFAGLVFFLTRGERQAAVLVNKVADRLPFVRAETVTALVQKVADRMKILFTSSEHLLVKAGIWAAANWLLDCASLYVFCLAFGARVSPIDVLVAYGLANILAVIPLTPGGLGVVELTIVAVLKGFGVPGGVAAAGVLSWRLVNFWLPIPFGGASYLSLRLGRTRASTGRQSRHALTAR